MCICKLTGRYTDENLPSSGQYQFILLPLTNTGQGIFTLATLETFYQKASITFFRTKLTKFFLCKVPLNNLIITKYYKTGSDAFLLYPIANIRTLRYEDDKNNVMFHLRAFIY